MVSSRDKVGEESEVYCFFFFCQKFQTARQRNQITDPKMKTIKL